MGRKTSRFIGERNASATLEIIEIYPSPGGPGKPVLLKVLCHFCNKHTKMIPAVFKKSNSCGCQRNNIETWKAVGSPRPWQLPSGEGARRNLEHVYRRNAVRRNLSFDLTSEEFTDIVTGFCNYCGNSLENTAKGQGKTSGDFVYTGIDREDINEGYTKTNSVSCCWMCNKMKWKLTKSDFIAHISKIYNHQKKS